MNGPTATTAIEPTTPPPPPLMSRAAAAYRRAYEKFDRWAFAQGLRSGSDLTLPDFLGIGAQKSGTTWLHENLRRHPGAFVPEVKEVHYFDKQFDRSLRDYAAIFEPAGRRIKGEITPAYGILPPDRVRFIRTVMPAVRLVFLMRNPIDRAWSHALMELVTQAGRSYDDVGEAEFLGHFRGEANLRRGDYEGILETWLGVFPREQLFVGFFEDVAARPVHLLTEIFRHIGLSTAVDWGTFPTREVVYRGAGVPLPPRYRDVLREVYRPRIQRLHARFGLPTEPWLRDVTGA